jgi:hypothetical protein
MENTMVLMYICPFFDMTDPFFLVYNNIKMSIPPPIIQYATETTDAIYNLKHAMRARCHHDIDELGATSGADLGPGAKLVSMITAPPWAPWLGVRWIRQVMVGDAGGDVEEQTYARGVV